jgi:hypothetical protein
MENPEITCRNDLVLPQYWSKGETFTFWRLSDPAVLGNPFSTIFSMILGNYANL